MWKAEFDATGQTPQQIDEAVNKINAGEMQWTTPDGKPALQVTRDEYVERTRQRREAEGMQAKERSIQELMTKGEHDLIAGYDAEIANIRVSPLTPEEQNVEIAKLEGMKSQVRDAVLYDRGARLTSQEARKAAAQPKTQLVQLSDGTSVAMYNDGQGRWGLVPQNNMLDAKGQPLMPTGAGSRAGGGATRGRAGQATDEIGDTGIGNQTRARDAYFENVKLYQTDTVHRDALWKRADAYLKAGYPVNGQVLTAANGAFSIDQVYAAMAEIQRRDTDFIEQGAAYADQLDGRRVGTQQQQATQQAGIMQQMAQQRQVQQQNIAPVLNAKGNEEAAQRPQRIVAAAIRAAAPGQGASANTGGLKPFPKGGPPAGGAAPQGQGPATPPPTETPRKEAPAAAPSVAESRKGKTQPEWMQRALPAPRRVEDMKATFIYSKVDPASGRVGYYRYTNGKMVKVGEW
jgi:hypothetical protein